MAAGTSPVYVKFRPRSAGSGAWIVVHGHDVASGAQSPVVETGHGSVINIAVTSADESAFKEYSVKISVPQASMDAARSAARARVDAALAIVGTLSPEDAAGALLGERSFEAARLDALDRLGNANGRYDLGDLLAWIERCRSGRGAARSRGGCGRCETPAQAATPTGAMSGMWT